MLDPSPGPSGGLVFPVLPVAPERLLELLLQRGAADSFVLVKTETCLGWPRDRVGRFLPTGEPLRAQENGRTVFSASSPWDGLSYY